MTHSRHWERCEPVNTHLACSASGAAFYFLYGRFCRTRTPQFTESLKSERQRSLLLPVFEGCSRWFLGGPSKLIATFLSWREEGATPAGCRYQQHIQQGPRLFQWGEGLSGLRPSIKADWKESHGASIAIWWPNREVRIIKNLLRGKMLIFQTHNDFET